MISGVGGTGGEFVMEGVEGVAGGDGHSGGGVSAEVRERRISSNCGLSAGSCLQQSSTVFQI